MVAVVSDWWNHPEAQEWLERCKRELLPKMENSALMVPLWTGKIDAKMAVELGYMIGLDKPIILIVAAGTKVPNKLALIADEIIEGNPGDPSTRDRLGAALERLGMK